MLIARLLVAVTGAGMALVLAVVILIYAIYIPDTPHLSQELPTLGLTAGIFAALGGVAVGSAMGTIRQWHAKWAWDAALLVGVPLAAWLLLRVYG